MVKNVRGLGMFLE